MKNVVFAKTAMFLSEAVIMKGSGLYIDATNDWLTLTCYSGLRDDVRDSVIRRPNPAGVDPPPPPTPHRTAVTDKAITGEHIQPCVHIAQNAI